MMQKCGTGKQAGDEHFFSHERNAIARPALKNISALTSMFLTRIRLLV
jgi:hypothetical protein